MILNPNETRVCPSTIRARFVWLAINGSPFGVASAAGMVGVSWESEQVYTEYGSNHCGYGSVHVDFEHDATLW